MPENIDPSFPFLVEEKSDGTLRIIWDPEHPVTSVFNTWTEEDFISMLMEHCQEVIDGIEAINA